MRLCRRFAALLLFTKERLRLFYARATARKKTEE